MYKASNTEEYEYTHHVNQLNHHDTNIIISHLIHMMMCFFLIVLLALRQSYACSSDCAVTLKAMDKTHLDWNHNRIPQNKNSIPMA